MERFLKKTGPERVAAKLGQMQGITVADENGTKVVRVLSDGKYNAVLTMRKDLEGTLEWSGSRQWWPLSACPTAEEIKGAVEPAVNRMLEEEMEAVFGREGEVLQAVRDWINKRYGDFGEAKERAARLAGAKARVGRKGRKKGSKRHTLNEILLLASNTIRDEMVDPKTAELARKLTTRPGEFHMVLTVRMGDNVPEEKRTRSRKVEQPRIPDYNTVAISRDALRGLAKSNEKLARYYCQATGKGTMTPVRAKHPGQLVRAMREHLGTDPPQWKVFSRTGAPPRSESQRPDEDGIRLGCRAVAEANCPEAREETYAGAAHLTNEHRWFAEARWERGDPWRAWTQTINRFLDPEQGGENENELRTVADTLRYHIENNLPWGPAPWPSLRNRATRWHQERQQARIRNTRTPEEAQASWKPALETREGISGTIRPIRSVPELDRAAAELQNCLSSYWKQCVQGNSRVFVIESGGRIKAAFDIVKQEGNWALHSVEGPKWRRKAEPEERADAENTARAYQQAAGRG